MTDEEVQAMRAELDALKTRNQQYEGYIRGLQSSGGGGGKPEPRKSAVSSLLAKLEGDENLSTVVPILRELSDAVRSDLRAESQDDIEPLRAVAWDLESNRRFDAAFKKNIVGQFGDGAQELYEPLREKAMELARTGQNVSLPHLLWEINPEKAQELHATRATTQGKAGTAAATKQTQTGFGSTKGIPPGPHGGNPFPTNNDDDAAPREKTMAELDAEIMLELGLSGAVE